MKLLLKQLKNRRLALGLKQKDMTLRIGMSRQQYQYLESRGNPGLNTLELIAKGLKSELMLIPEEKLSLIKAILENETSKQSKESTLANDPWKNLLGSQE